MYGLGAWRRTRTRKAKCKQRTCLTCPSPLTQLGTRPTHRSELAVKIAVAIPRNTVVLDSASMVRHQSATPLHMPLLYR